MRPEWAPRAHFPVRIIDSLLVRAADDAVRHDDRLDSVPSYKFQYLAGDDRVCPNVRLLGEPPLQDAWLGVLLNHNPNRYFAGALVIRPIERNRCGRKTLKTMPGLLLQR